MGEGGSGRVSEGGSWRVSGGGGSGRVSGGGSGGGRREREGKWGREEGAGG